MLAFNAYFVVLNYVTLTAKPSLPYSSSRTRCMTQSDPKLPSRNSIISTMFSGMNSGDRLVTTAEGTD